MGPDASSYELADEDSAHEHGAVVMPQERLPAVEPGLCQVPDAGALFYEDELTDVSTESM